MQVAENEQDEGKIKPPYVLPQIRTASLSFRLSHYHHQREFIKMKKMWYNTCCGTNEVTGKQPKIGWRIEVIARSDGRDIQAFQNVKGIQITRLIQLGFPIGLFKIITMSPTSRLVTFLVSNLRQVLNFVTGSYSVSVSGYSLYVLILWSCVAYVWAYFLY